MTAKIIHKEINPRRFQSVITITENDKAILRHAIETINNQNDKNETILTNFIIDYCFSIIKAVVNLPASTPVSTAQNSPPPLAP
jgi:hypothetical protein